MNQYHNPCKVNNVIDIKLILPNDTEYITSLFFVIASIIFVFNINSTNN